jgi:hypothetical protein
MKGLSSVGSRHAPALNWTSTMVPLWESDLINFWRAGKPFEVRDVTTTEQSLILTQFAASHELDVIREGSKVILVTRG